MADVSNLNTDAIFERNVPGIRGILSEKTVAVAGCGGLGSNAAVALVRAGVGKLIIVDFDTVEISNLNRQYFFIKDIGKRKVDALSAHLKNINPEVEIVAHHIKLTADRVDSVFKEAHLLIEAFDRAESKAWLIETWCIHFPDRPCVCGSGISGYGSTETLRVQRAGKLIICGDQETDMSMGLISARVAIAANMQANVAIELLVSGKI